MEVAKENKDSIFLSANLRLLRKQQNWSQEELATRIGLNRGNIASYEKGTAEPKICNLLKLAKLFQVSIIDLTKRKLDSQDDVRTIRVNFKQLEADELNGSLSLKGMQQHAKEITAAVNGIYSCQCWKAKNLENDSKEVQMLLGNFDHLYEMTQQLLAKHQELLNFVSSNCPQIPPPSTEDSK